MSRNYVFFAAILLALFSIVSCRQNELVSDEYRNNLSLKSELEQKNLFKKLNTDSQLELWQNKLEQIKRENISDEQRNLINNISKELSNIEEKNFNGQKLFEYAVEMAQITPEDEFIRMFSKLEDYKRNEGSYKGFVSSQESHSKSFIETDLLEYLSRIKEGKVKIKLYKGDDSSSSTERPACNCKWTCSFYGPRNTKCDFSTAGCGFLWLQECTGYIGI